VRPMEATPADEAQDAALQDTAFRSWTWSPGGSAKGGEVVPGLRALLRNVGLSSYRDIVESWCEDMGAAFLGDLSGEDELAALARVLSGPGGLAAPASQRLCSALRSASRDEGKENASNEIVTEKKTILSASCYAMLHAVSKAERDQLCTTSDHRSEPVPGLRAVLWNTGLSGYCGLVEAWCREMGASFLAELAGEDEVEALEEELCGKGGAPAALCQRFFSALRRSAGIAPEPDRVPDLASARKPVTAPALRRTDSVYSPPAVAGSPKMAPALRRTDSVLSLPGVVQDFVETESEYRADSAGGRQVSGLPHARDYRSSVDTAVLRRRW